MKLTSIAQSYHDGDFGVLQIAPSEGSSSQYRVIYGSVLKPSTLLRYLPAYFDFQDDEVKQ
jgi:hypothetical protein